jgi:hypothetical protein
MSTLSQANVEAIVDAFAAAILKRSPLHPQTPAQTHPQTPAQTTQTPAQTHPPTMATLSQAHKPIQTSTVFEIGIFGPFEIGVFEPDVDDPLDDLSVYRDVDVFCQHVEDVISVRGPETVRDNLHLCLRGAANRWWSCELSQVNKMAIRDDTTPWLCQWICRLQDRFRQYAARRLYAGHLVTYGLRRYYTSDLIVDDPHSAADVVTSVDTSGQHAFISTDVVCQHAGVTCVDGPAQAVFTPELIVNDVDIGLPICHPVGDVPTSIDAFG